MFNGAEAEMVATRLASECGHNVADGWSAEELDRLRFAVLKLSEGSIDKFEAALTLAKTDWRDLLMCAGFGEDVNAHRRWVPWCC
jgi:hypothetical protein